MSPQLMIRLAIVAMILIAIAIFFIDRRRTHRCPQCKSNKIKEVDRLTEDVQLNKNRIPGIGSKLNISATVSMRCHTCGHTWQKKEIT